MESQLDPELVTFVNGLLKLNTRRFAIAAELILRNFVPQNAFKRVLFRSSKVFSDEKHPITESNLFAICMNANNVLIPSVSLESFDCNIQQLKCSEFDYLVYALFWKDKIEVFGISSEDIFNSTYRVGYSPFQHKGNFGEGQFHVNNTNIDSVHRTAFKIGEISYCEVYKFCKRFEESSFN